MFSITESPSALSKFAVCLATTVISVPAITSLKPSPRSTAAEAPGIPSNSTTLAASPSCSMMYSPASLPPATLSEAICVITSPLLAERSNVITGISASLALAIASPTASESVGLIKIKSTPWVIKSSILESSRVESSCESRTTTSIPPILSASSSTPSLRSTKNGLFKVDTISPTVLSSAPFSPGLSIGSQATKAKTKAKLTRIAKNFFICSSLCSSYSVVLQSKNSLYLRFSTVTAVKQNSH